LSGELRFREEIRQGTDLNDTKMSSLGMAEFCSSNFAQNLPVCT